MNQDHDRWKIWIDTGGTFTDCLAFSPSGQLKRLKVLSSSALRGKLVKQLGPSQYKVSVNWPVSEDIFAGYTFRLPGGEGLQATVSSFDPKKEVIILDKLAKSFRFDKQDFEISAGEEAPILAARLATHTPLKSSLPPIDMRLGSTKGTNALLERKGAPTALLLTQGFQDLLSIDTQQRPDLFTLNIKKPAAYYHQVIEVKERLDASGDVVTPLTANEIQRVLAKLKKTQVETVAIALMHSYLNDKHEQQLAEVIKNAGYRYVSCSAVLAPSIKILPRAKTALVNAYLSPSIGNYLQSVKDKLNQNSLGVMTSAGGLVNAELYHPKDSLLSGPAGGVVGAASICRQLGTMNGDVLKILAFDMGGTSTDVSRYDGEYDYRYQTRVGDIELFSPSLAIETVAAGGGSCCNFDGHKLSVGPESASASPGPACYGFGGPLTLTDVNLLLGRMSEGNFGIPVRREAAEKALGSLLQNMSLAKNKAYSREEVLTGLLAIANEKMTDTIRKISVSKGYNPQDYALLAFGGAGGQHACQLAETLHIDQVIVPYDAGLLSAYGMGQAVVERITEKQVLRPLEEVKYQISDFQQKLYKQALTAMQQEGFAEESLSVRFVKLMLRFSGQESSLEIDYSPERNIAQDFREKYTLLYGHWLDGQALELESIKLALSTKDAQSHHSKIPTNLYHPEESQTQTTWVRTAWQEVPMYFWENLRPGASIVGPALVVSQNCSTFVDAGWHFLLDDHNTARLQCQQTDLQQVAQQPEAVQLELFTNRFRAIAEEMGALLQRTSFSVNVKERLDFSCALLDAEGYLVANAPHVPVHLGSMGLCVRSVRAQLEMQQGDVVVTNHPGYGGSHLPDITLISPVYYEKQKVGYVAARAHHAEIGGKQPGSMPPDARVLTEEGIVISPEYLVKKGEARWEHIRKLFTDGTFPSRSPSENMADLNGALASVQAGTMALQKLCESYGTDKVKVYMQRLKQYAHHSLWQGLSDMPRGSYEAHEYLDDSTPICVKIDLTKQQLSVDFTGSGAVHPHNFNATLAIINSTVLYVLRLLVHKNIPLNEGLMQNVRLQVPMDSLLNPHFPENPALCPAVVGGNTETSQRVVDTLTKALGMAACSQGTMNNLLFGNERFGYYETIGGGSGAGNGFHGADAVHQHMTNTRITDPEVLEFRYPVRLMRFAVREDSGGAGKWKGGDGIIRDLMFLEKVSLTLLTQHRQEVPFGMQGGAAGQPGCQYIVRKNGVREDLESVGQAQMQAGDRIVIETPGGGGFGSD